MAEVIALRDGSSEYVFDEPKEFLARLILEKLGMDAARLFNAAVDELEDELKYSEESREEAESIADGYLALCREALADLGVLKALVNNQRIDKVKLQTAVDKAHRNLKNNL